MAKVGELFRMSRGEAGIQWTTLVTIIRGGGGISHFKRLDHGKVSDRAGPHSITDTNELPIPARGGHPYFETDVGVRRRADRAGDATEGGQSGIGHRWGTGRAAAHAGRRLEGTGGNAFRQGDLSVRQFQ